MPNLVRAMSFWNILHQIHSKFPNVFGSNKTKVSKQPNYTTVIYVMINHAVNAIVSI